MTEEVFDNFHNAPLEEQDPNDDGDDSIPPHERPIYEPQRVMMARAPATPTLVVPFRPCRPGDQGDHVYAMKRMHARYRGGGRLARLMAKPPAVRRSWSKYQGVGSFYRDFRETRRMLGLSETPVVYDDDVWRKLAKYADSLTLKLLVPPTQTVYQRRLAWHMALYNRRMSIAYSQARPSQLGKAETVTYADCSGSVAGGCNWAGVLPQIDWHYTNTDVQIAFGVPVKSIASALPGDVVFYGVGSDPSHEAMYLGGSRVWSFGSYPIKLLDVDYRHDRIAIRRFTP